MATKGIFYYSLKPKKYNLEQLNYINTIKNNIKIVEDTTEVKKLVNKFIKNPESFSIQKLEKLNISGLEKMAVIHSLLNKTQWKI